MAIAAAENFQLKWHSYGAYMHNSVATLLRSETFTDITLATVDGRQIQAHRFVLSACSSYLHQLLRVVYPTTNSNNPIVIVLPSEISYRILKVLVEYMYSGEATVSYGQLDGILKAAHILGIRGLCRESNLGDNSTSLPTHRHTHDENERCKRTSSDHKSTSNDERVLQESSRSNSNRCDKSASQEVNDKSDESESNEETPTNKEGTKKEPAMPISGGENHITKHTQSASADIMESGPVQLLVKQEPIEWVDTELEEPLDENESMHAEMIVKPEIGLNVGDGDEQTLYTPLSCDICQKTFTTPADWVHHIEAHPEIYQHSSRQRTMKNSEVLENSNQAADFPPLRCELCEVVFTTPGDWVRHIQSSHTEQELAISNNSYEPSKIKRGGRKRCQMCGKTFPSYASMMIHRRTHTGEKPYICAICSKGFNVKSNLLRHLRTLHDQIVSPSNVE